MFLNLYIIDFLNENNNTCKHLMWEDSTEEFEELITKLGVGISSVDSYGGEGQGQEFWSVIKFFEIDNKEKPFMHIRFNGWYASYHGSEYTDFDIVEEKEIMTTIWDVVNETDNLIKE